MCSSFFFTTTSSAAAFEGFLFAFLVATHVVISI